MLSRLIYREPPRKIATACDLGRYCLLDGDLLGQSEKEGPSQGAPWTLELAFQEYVSDKQNPPATLQDLIAKHYVREIPTDPMRGSNSTWLLVPTKLTVYELTDFSTLKESKVEG
jgi:hypothetical protein